MGRPAGASLFSSEGEKMLGGSTRRAGVRRAGLCSRKVRECGTARCARCAQEEACVRGLSAAVLSTTVRRKHNIAPRGSEVSGQRRRHGPPGHIRFVGVRQTHTRVVGAAPPPRLLEPGRGVGKASPPPLPRCHLHAESEHQRQQQLQRCRMHTFLFSRRRVLYTTAAARGRHGRPRSG